MFSGEGEGWERGNKKLKLSLLPGGSISDEKKDVYVIPRTADSRSPWHFSAFPFCFLCYFIQGDSVTPTTTMSTRVQGRLQLFFTPAIENKV